MDTGLGSCRRKAIVMTPHQFNAAVAKLGLSVYAVCTVLGVSRNQAYRYSSGRAVVPVPIARLLTMLVRYGVPGEWRK